MILGKSYSASPFQPMLLLWRLMKIAYRRLVVGLDIIFSEPDLKDKDADRILSDAIRQAKNVVLPVLIESTRTNGQVIESLPLPIYAESAADLGRVHVVLDEDGIARSIYLFEGIGAPVWQHFA